MKVNKIHIFAELPDQESIDTNYLDDERRYFFIFIKALGRLLNANYSFFKDQINYSENGLFILKESFGRLRVDLNKIAEEQQKKIAPVAVNRVDSFKYLNEYSLILCGDFNFYDSVSYFFGRPEIAKKMKGSFSEYPKTKSVVRIRHDGEYKNYAEFFAAYIKIYSEENPGLLTREMDYSSYVYNIPGLSAADIIRLFKNKNDAHVFLQKKVSTALTFLAGHTTLGTVVVLNDKPRELENKAADNAGFIDEVNQYIETQENIELIQIGLYSSDQQELLAEVKMHFDLHKLTEETINQLEYEWCVYNDFEKWTPIKAAFAKEMMAKEVDL